MTSTLPKNSQEMFGISSDDFFCLGTWQEDEPWCHSWVFSDRRLGIPQILDPYDGYPMPVELLDKMDIWLVVTGTFVFIHIFCFWRTPERVGNGMECHHPNWLLLAPWFFRGVGGSTTGLSHLPRVNRLGPREKTRILAHGFWSFFSSFFREAKIRFNKIAKNTSLGAVLSELDKWNSPHCLHSLDHRLSVFTGRERERDSCASISHFVCRYYINACCLRFFLQALTFDGRNLLFPANLVWQHCLLVRTPNRLHKYILQIIRGQIFHTIWQSGPTHSKKLESVTHGNWSKFKTPFLTTDSRMSMSIDHHWPSLIILKPVISTIYWYLLDLLG